MISKPTLLEEPILDVCLVMVLDLLIDSLIFDSVIKSLCESSIDKGTVFFFENYGSAPTTIASSSCICLENTASSVGVSCFLTSKSAGLG